MRKIVMCSVLLIALASCGGNTDTNATHADSANNAGMTTSSTPDSTKPGDGTINSNVISTDTAAMNTQNSVDKAKDAKKDK